MCTGSSLLVAGYRHIHRYYKFAVPLVKTSPRLLRHSCRSELHVLPQFPAAQTIRSPERSESRISLPKYFRLPCGKVQGRRVMESSFDPIQGVSTLESLRGFVSPRILPSVLPATPC